MGGLQVGIACVNLTSLKAAGCPGLTLNAVAGFPMLRDLDLSGCDCIAPATAVRAQLCAFLRMLLHVSTARQLGLGSKNDITATMEKPP